MENNKMNLEEKIIEIRKCVKYLQKDKQGYQYKYVTGSAVLGAIRDKMDELKVICITEIIETTVDSDFIVLDSKGVKNNYHVIKHKMNKVWLDAETNKSITVPWFGCGQDQDISKADGKALTYSERYFFLKFFNIATDEIDPDKFQEENKITKSYVKPKTPKVPSEYEQRLIRIFEVLESNGWDRKDIEQYGKTLGYGTNAHGWDISERDEPSFINFFSKDKKDFLYEQSKLKEGKK